VGARCGGSARAARQVTPRRSRCGRSSCPAAVGDGDDLLDGLRTKTASSSGFVTRCRGVTLTLSPGAACPPWRLVCLTGGPRGFSRPRRRVIGRAWGPVESAGRRGLRLRGLVPWAGSAGIGSSCPRAGRRAASVRDQLPGRASRGPLAVCDGTGATRDAPCVRLVGPWWNALEVWFVGKVLAGFVPQVCRLGDNAPLLGASKWGGRGIVGGVFIVELVRRGFWLLLVMVISNHTGSPQAQPHLRPLARSGSSEGRPGPLAGPGRVPCRSRRSPARAG